MGLTKNEAVIVCSRLNDTSFNVRIEGSIASKLNRDRPVITDNKANMQINESKPAKTSIDNKRIDDKSLPTSREVKIEKDMEMEV